MVATLQAPLPILWLAARIRACGRHWRPLAAYALGGLNQWNYPHGYIGLPPATTTRAVGTPAVRLGVLLFRRLLLRGHTFAAALALPVVWVAVEYFNNLISPHGTFGSIGYTQMDALPVIQIAAVAGIWGIGFLVLLLPAAIAVQIAPQAPKHGRMSAAARPCCDRGRDRLRQLATTGASHDVATYRSGVIGETDPARTARCPGPDP